MRRRRVSPKPTRACVRATIDAQTQSDYAQAQSNLQQALTDLAARRETLFQAAVDGLPAAVVDRLQAFRASWMEGGVDPDAPAHFRIVRLTEAQWRFLALALNAERRAQRRGESLDSDAASLLSTYRADPRVAAAKDRLEFDLPTITAAWQ